jgi:ABC-2 type transport system permease protein
MKPYITMFRARFSLMLQYRTAAWAGFFTQAFFGFVIVMRYVGFFSSSVREQPMSLQETVSYIWLGQAMFTLLPFSLDAEFAERIRSGNIVYELTRPVTMYPFWFVRQTANRIVPFLLRGIPLFFFAAAVLPLVGLDGIALRLPGFNADLFLFIGSLLLAVFLSSSFSMIMNLSLFWTISGEGVVYIAPAFLMLLSGIIIPVPFFPEWIKPVINLLPFRGLIDIPIQIYLGQIDGQGIITHLLLQLSWIGLLLLAGHIILKKALKRVVIQGG